MPRLTRCLTQQVSLGSKGDTDKRRTLKQVKRRSIVSLRDLRSIIDRPNRAAQTNTYILQKPTYGTAPNSQVFRAAQQAEYPNIASTTPVMHPERLALHFLRCLGLQREGMPLLHVQVRRSI